MSTTRAALVARTLFASATARSQPAPACRAARPFSSTSPSPFTWTRAPRSDVPLPWFVDPETAPTASPQPASPQLATAPVPTPPPPHLPQALHPLHNYLSTSPFLDRDELAYIHAREADPEGSWCDWVVVATLKEGRERGIRGAVEGVRRHLATNPVDLSSPIDLPFAPPSTSPLIHGLPAQPSKHARSRASRSARSSTSPSRSDNASGWAMLDAGTLVVHVFTREGRELYGRGIEDLWEGIGEEERGEGWRSARARAEDELRERELAANMDKVRAELDAEAAQDGRAPR